MLVLGTVTVKRRFYHVRTDLTISVLLFQVTLKSPVVLIPFILLRYAKLFAHLNARFIDVRSVR